MLPNDINTIFRTKPLKDIILAGFGDDMWGMKTFHLMPSTAFLEFSDTIIRLKSIEGDSKIQLSIVDKSAYSAPFDFEIDPDDELVVFPAINFFIGHDDMGAFNIQKVTLFHDAKCDLSQSEYRAISFTLSGYANYIFFGSIYHLLGMTMGNMDRQTVWLEHWEERLEYALGKLTIKTIDYSINNSEKSDST